MCFFPLSVGAAHLRMATTATTTTKVEVAYTDRAKHFTREWRKSPGSGLTKLGESLSDSGSITLVQNAEVKDVTCWEKTTLACGCYLNYMCWCSPYCCLCNLFRYQTTGDVCPYPVSSLKLFSTWIISYYLFFSFFFFLQITLTTFECNLCTKLAQ